MTEKTIIQMYNGEVELSYLELAKRHRYLVNGKEKKGATTILNVLNKPALMLWPLREAMSYVRANIGTLWVNDELDADTLEELLAEAETAYQRKGDKGKDVGTIVHQACEQFLKAMQTGQNTLDIDAVILDNDEARKAFTAFIDWYQAQEDIQVLAVEEVVYSRDFDYCGKFDCLLEIDGQKILVDIKTTNASRTAPLGIYAENFLQLGAYAGAYEEEKGEDIIDDLMVVNCSKKGVVSTLKASDIGLSKLECVSGFIATLNMFHFMNETEYKIKNYKEVA